MPGFLTRLFGSANERTLRRLRPIVEEVNGLEESFRALPDSAFAEKTAGFRERLAEAGDEDAAATLEEILPEAFAAVREASRRTIGLRHFDVQLLGGIVLHEGKIAEMKTGEGKTLVATLPLYLNALVAKGAHLVTVNDYLARRDVQWMGPIYQFLGLTVASIMKSPSGSMPSFLTWSGVTVLGRRLGARRAKRRYSSLLASAGPEIISGVRASSIRMLSTSSTIP